MKYIQTDQRTRLAMQVLNPKGRDALVLVHGWPLSHKIFEYQLDVLPHKDICCITYDLRGYGDSDKPFSGYSYDRMADDLYKVMQSIGHKSVTLLGFSMGGAIVTRYMARHKGYKVRKLILCGAACPSFVKTSRYPHGMTKEQVNKLIEQSYSDRPAMCDSFGKLCFANPISEPFRQWFSQLTWSASGRATIAGLEYLRDENLEQDLRQIRVPTMILHGKKDRVCPFPFALEQHKAIAGSFIVPFEQSSHCLFFEEKEKFTSCIADFVKRR